MSRSHDVPRQQNMIEQIGALRRPHTRTEDGWIKVGGDAPLSPEWQNGWMHANPVRPVSFYMNSVGMVSIRGEAAEGEAGTVAFTLPEGYRPEFDQEFVGSSSLGTGISRFRVATNGDVVILQTGEEGGSGGGGGDPDPGANGFWKTVGGVLTRVTSIAWSELTGIPSRFPVGVRKNSTGSTFERQRINLIEGSNVTITIADDSTNEEVDVTIASSGGGGGGGPHADTHEDGGGDEINLQGLSGVPAELANHEADTTNIHGIADTADLILEGDSRLTDSRPPSGAAGGVLAGNYPDPDFASDMATQAELDAHINDTDDAHDASAISFVPAGSIAATDVQAAIEEVASEASAGGELAYAERTSDLSVTATTAATANTIVTAPTVTLDGSTRIKIEFFSPGVRANADGFTIVNLWDGSSDIGRLALFFDLVSGSATGDILAPAYAVRYLTPSAGSHDYSARAYRTAANGAITGGAGGTDTAFPAFIRVSLA